ncbi:hypothetical protein ASPTUDRAFT_43273 [Aspergillus tubingensis CBS 134.48]|uniref:Uncharacterized protein n=2 Tax=Aspergillus subgen. Circumdati TaxID=2720871 RepID=A0A1L9N558_ASPTC|nr:hypothetical protein ASPTUDRAFT_43273 [Aspergillus tubingensis CBS 134.48]
MRKEEHCKDLNDSSGEYPRSRCGGRAESKDSRFSPVPSFRYRSQLPVSSQVWSGPTIRPSIGMRDRLRSYIGQLAGGPALLLSLMLHSAWQLGLVSPGSGCCRPATTTWSIINS